MIGNFLSILSKDTILAIGKIGNWIYLDSSLDFIILAISEIDNFETDKSFEYL